jgi:hypothetical protein
VQARVAGGVVGARDGQTDGGRRRMDGNGHRDLLSAVRVWRVVAL